MKRCADNLIPLPKRAKVDSGLSFVDLPEDIFYRINQFLSFEEWCALKGTCHTIRNKALQTRQIALLNPFKMQRFPSVYDLRTSSYQLLAFIQSGYSSVDRLRHIQTLHIRKQTFSDYFFATRVLKTWPNQKLKQLIIEFGYINNEDIFYIGRLTELTKLVIRGTYTTTLKPLNALTNLRTLSLQNARSTYLSNEHLTQLLESLPYLQHLAWLNSRSVTREAVQQVAKISCLRTVDFTGSVIQKPAYPDFAKLTQIHTLRISGSRMTLSDINHLRQLPLRELSLRSNRLGKHAFFRLPKSLQCLSLLSENLREFYYQSAHLHYLHLHFLPSFAALKTLPRLQHLIIERGINIHDLPQLTRLPHLKTFSIQTITITLLLKLMSLPLAFPNTSPQYWITILNTGCSKEQLETLSKQIHGSIP